MAGQTLFFMLFLLSPSLELHPPAKSFARPLFLSFSQDNVQTSTVWPPFESHIFCGALVYMYIIKIVFCSC